MSIDQKRCSRCREWKNKTTFIKSRARNDGLAAYCKECGREYYREHRKTILAASSRYQKEHRQYCAAKSKNFRKTEKWKMYYAAWIKKYRKQYPEKYRAQNAVELAIKHGRLIRPCFCELCGKSIKLESHHADYSKVLEVIWVCKVCHSNIHAKRKVS